MKRPLELALVIAVVGVLAMWMRPLTSASSPSPARSAVAFPSPSTPILSEDCRARVSSLIEATGIDLKVPASFQLKVEADVEFNLREGDNFVSIRVGQDLNQT